MAEQLTGLEKAVLATKIHALMSGHEDVQIIFKGEDDMRDLDIAKDCISFVRQAGEFDIPCVESWCDDEPHGECLFCGGCKNTGHDKPECIGIMLEQLAARIEAASTDAGGRGKG